MLAHTVKTGSQAPSKLRLLRVVPLVAVAVLLAAVVPELPGQTPVEHEQTAPTQESEPSEPEAEEVIAPISGDDDPLEKVIGQMRQAEHRISARDTGTETQTLQRQIVDDLDRLIELAKQQSRQQRPQSNQQQQPQDDSASQSDQQQSAGQQQQQSEKQQGSGATQGVTRQENEQAAQSTERNDKAEEIEVELQRRNQLISEFWGHLPPAIRQQLLNIREEKYLPKYGELVRQYFEALAEQGTRDRER